MSEITTYSDPRALLQSLLESKKLPNYVKTVEDAVTIAQMGKELGFGVMTSFHNILPIQGRLTLNAKGIGAKLRQGGVQFITLEDAVWVYADESTSEYQKSGDKPIDRRTKIKFIRGGLEEIVSFTWKDAKLQNLTDKDNWTRMPKEMLYARCLAKGANRIGQDLLLGLYTSEEIADSFPISEAKIIRDEDGMITEISY